MKTSNSNISACHTTDTFRNRLHAANLRAFRPAVRPKLILRHRTDRFQWAQKDANWELHHWTPVRLTDESRFCVDFHDGRKRVKHTTGERYADCPVAERDTFGVVSVMVSVCISMTGKINLHVIAGNLTGVRYWDEILHSIVRRYAGAVGDDFILMDDNARSHRDRVVKDYIWKMKPMIEWPGWIFRLILIP
jgi:hypothetical protein